jgi:AraC-like DNA-binding protein
LRLSIVAYLPKPFRIRLRAGVQPPHTLDFSESWADVVFLVRRSHVDAFFVDCAIEPNAVATIARFIEEFPSVAVILYSTLTVSTMQCVKQIAKKGLHEVLLADVEDTPLRIGHLLESIPQSRLVPLVVFHLSKELGRLDATIAERVRAIFENPFMIRSVDELAAYCGMSRTVLYETFADVGLGSPKRLIIGARLMRAYVYLQDRGQGFRFVVRKCGFAEYRTLRDHLTAAFGLSVAELRQWDDQDILVRRLVAWMKGEPRR